MKKITVSMTKLYFDHTDAVFPLFFILYYFYFYFFGLSKFSNDFPIIPPDENSWIRTGTLNEYMSI